jgi:hypothetical protein
MNPFEMTVLIVLIVAAARVAKARYGRHQADPADSGTAPQDQVNIQLMADEVRRLRDRVAVLERIATDGEGPSKLDREIEALRLKDR